MAITPGTRLARQRSRFAARAPNGVYETWAFLLVRRDGRWKVSDERWETRLDGKEPQAKRIISGRAGPTPSQQ